MRTVWLADPVPAMEAITTQLQAMESDRALPEDVRLNAAHAYNAIRLRMLGEDPRTPEAVRTTDGKRDPRVAGLAAGRRSSRRP
jgi:hypothetical protein